MLHVLTDPDVVSVQIARSGWTVKSLLRHVAHAEPRLNALIDTGALITGMSNKSVARYLLANGLGRWCEGVVFLDENDEKMIFVKATGRVLKLSQCGISVDKRFAFYDQIHTTGTSPAMPAVVPAPERLLLCPSVSPLSFACTMVRCICQEWTSNTR